MAIHEHDRVYPPNENVLWRVVNVEVHEGKCHATCKSPDGEEKTYPCYVLKEEGKLDFGQT